MAWFRLGGAGISAALKNAMNAVLNKKLGTSQVYDPNEWPDEVNLLGALEEKTVSSSPIVTFSDGADAVPLKKCEITLTASLDGYSEIDVVSTGKNLANFVNGYGLNAQGYPELTASRIATLEPIPIKSGETYKLYYERVGGTGAGIISVFNGDTLVRRVTGISSGSTLNTSDGDKFYLCIYGSGSTDIKTIENSSPMCLLATEIDTTYEPYNGTTHTADLGRTIYGGSVDVVSGEGVDENDNPFTFDPVPIDSKLGNNTMWAEQGDIEVTYRSQGTVYQYPEGEGVSF